VAVATRESSVSTTVPQRRQPSNLAGMRVIRYRTSDEAFDAMHETKFGQEIEAAIDDGGSC
jgi:hypothetical protein